MFALMSDAAKHETDKTRVFQKYAHAETWLGIAPKG
jgi:hypothetical protein